MSACPRADSQACYPSLVQSLLCYGYGNDTMVRFLQVLQQHGISGVLDIRDEGLQIRDEFDPEQLAELLSRLSILYLQVPILMVPDDLASRPRTNGSAGSFLEEYSQYLANLDPEARRQLGKLSDLEGNWMLLCAEEDPAICHRRIAGLFLGKLLGITAEAVRELGSEESS